MDDPLALAVAQPACRARDVAANVAQHARLVRWAGGGVVVFPELSLTGYEPDAAAVDPVDPVLAPLVAACAATGATALVGAPVADGPAREAGRTGRHLAVLGVDGAGVRVAYRKVCLGAAERASFEPGPGPRALEVGRWRLGLGVCRDTGVPAQVEATVALGVDAYVAGVCHHDHELAEQDARGAGIARRHGVAVALASFAGPTGGGFARTAGTSTIWGPDAGVLARASVRHGCVVGARLTGVTRTT